MIVIYMERKIKKKKLEITGYNANKNNKHGQRMPNKTRP